MRRQQDDNKAPPKGQATPDPKVVPPRRKLGVREFFYHPQQLGLAFQLVAAACR